MGRAAASTVSSRVETSCTTRCRGPARALRRGQRGRPDPWRPAGVPATRTRPDRHLPAPGGRLPTPGNDRVFDLTGHTPRAPVRIPAGCGPAGGGRCSVTTNREPGTRSGVAMRRRPRSPPVGFSTRRSGGHALRGWRISPPRSSPAAGAPSCWSSSGPGRRSGHRLRHRPRMAAVAPLAAAGRRGQAVGTVGEPGRDDRRCGVPVLGGAAAPAHPGDDVTVLVAASSAPHACRWSRPPVRDAAGVRSASPPSSPRAFQPSAGRGRPHGAPPSTRRGPLQRGGRCVVPAPLRPVDRVVGAADARQGGPPAPRFPEGRLRRCDWVQVASPRPVTAGHLQRILDVDASGGHGSFRSGLAGHSSSRAPRTAACSENRSSGLATL